MSVVVLAEERRAAGATVRRFAALAEAVAAEGLEGVAALRPLLNGKEIQALLDLPNGPGVGMATTAAIHWQIDHPAGTADDLRAHLASAPVADRLRQAAAAASKKGASNKK